MMMKYFLFLIIIWCNCSIYGQNFEKIFSYQKDAFGIGIAEYNGHYFLSTVFTSSEYSKERKGAVYKLDQFGSITDSLIFFMPDKWFVIPELVVTSNGLFGYGHTIDKSTEDNSGFYFLADENLNLSYVIEAGTDSTEEWFSDMNYPGGDTIYAVYDKKIAEIHIPTGNMQICSVYTEGQPNLIYLHDGTIHTWQDYVAPPRFRSYDIGTCAYLDSNELSLNITMAER